jgi:hypothetical protein|tara:strand:+ start:127 stop:459 length:333 start_codon:yes stop_codon:yes gene_type:complete
MSIEQDLDCTLNYYLITNDDPCFHAIYNEQELRELLNKNISYHNEKWECYDKNYFCENSNSNSLEESKNIDELINWLNKDIDECNWREPSNYHIQDNAHYNHIRRISSNR